MFDARQRAREDNWRDVDRSWRDLPARLRPPSPLGVLGCVALEAKAVLTVRTKIQIKYPLLERRNQELVVREEWVKRQGEWYRVHPQS